MFKLPVTHGSFFCYAGVNFFENIVQTLVKVIHIKLKNRAVFFFFKFFTRSFLQNGTLILVGIFGYRKVVFYFTILFLHAVYRRSDCNTQKFFKMRYNLNYKDQS